MNAELSVPGLRLLSVGEVKRFPNEGVDLSEVVNEGREVGKERDRGRRERRGERGGDERSELLFL